MLSSSSSRAVITCVFLLATALPLAASTALPFPGPIRGDDETTGNRRNVLDESPLTARPPANAQYPKLIFFPPNPPPLGVTVRIEEGRTITTGGPESMNPYVTDPFYAPVSTFISPVVTAYQGGETMSTDDRVKLRRWEESRDKLLKELREAIQSLRYADANTRLRDFIALAERQTPEIVELEKAAETMRARFARKSPWNERREWRLPRQRPASNVPGSILEIQVMRAAAFYFDGLSPAQRRLLREIAMELEGTTFLPKDGRSSASLFVFFQPETSRIPRAPRLPDGASRLLRKFIDDKARLKDELRDAIYEADSSDNHRRLATLAESHEPRFASIEETAEDLRSALARAPEFARYPAPAPLPPPLVLRIEAYLAARGDIVARTGRADDEALESLLGEMDALRAAIALVPGAMLEEGQAPDAFLMNFLKQRREAEAYYEYDIATLEPGLSPEQRRLLFSGAIQRLELPLPGAEEQPTLAPGTLLR